MILLKPMIRESHDSRWSNGSIDKAPKDVVDKLNVHSVNVFEADSDYTGDSRSGEYKRTIAAVFNGYLCGYCVVSYPSNDESNAYIDMIETAKTARRKGIATAMLKYASTWDRQKYNVKVTGNFVTPDGEKLMKHFEKTH